MTLLDHCLDCEYPRLGLDRGQPCPECGATPPGPDALVIVGLSEAGSPLIQALRSMLAACVFLAFLLFTAWWWGGGRTAGQLTTYAAFAIAALALGLRAVERFRAKGKGIDVVWIVTPDQIEVRSPLVATLREPATAYGRCTLRSSMLRRWHRLRLTPRFWNVRLVPKADVWLRGPRGEAKELRDRVRAALAESRRKPRGLTTAENRGD